MNMIKKTRYHMIRMVKPKCEIASKLLNYDRKGIVNDIAKTVDIKNAIGDSDFTIEDGDITPPINID